MPERVPARVLRRRASILTARAVVTVRLLRPHCRRRARRRHGAGDVAAAPVGGLDDLGARPRRGPAPTAGVGAPTHLA
ncbi:hypothetical protein ACWFQT_11445 [Cellulosimicrobium cellulans]|uniref:Uncharacterized protein n=1 Tax=Cellulosimicrobium cellulans F16 TaxID=1350482 RepID=A0A0M0F290_CELCE|nr:hypothetical protein [Cellulosimicrobium cellulans]KON71603.1 hypothetical protein M768_18740 [Cellulosimicrobium cellulans F16]